MIKKLSTSQIILTILIAVFAVLKTVLGGGICCSRFLYVFLPAWNHPGGIPWMCVCDCIWGNSDLNGRMCDAHAENTVCCCLCVYSV